MRKNFAVTELAVSGQVKFLSFDAYGQNLVVAHSDSLSLHSGKQWTDPVVTATLNSSAGPVKAFAVHPRDLIVATTSGNDLGYYGV